eukprot:UN30056
MCGVFDGSVWEMLAMINGYNYGVPYIDEQKFADMEGSWPSSIWLTPNPQPGGEDRIIGYTPGKNYKLSETADLMDHAGKSAVADMKRRYYNANSWTTLSDPGVKTYCWFTNNLPTPNALNWTNTDLKAAAPEVIYTSGDTTVQIDSFNTLYVLGEKLKQNYI